MSESESALDNHTSVSSTERESSGPSGLSGPEITALEDGCTVREDVISGDEEMDEGTVADLGGVPGVPRNPPFPFS